MAALCSTYHNLVKNYINLYKYESALFWAEKIVANSNDPADIYQLGQCLYLLKEHQRAVFLFRSRDLDKTYLLCNYLTAKCLFEVKEYNEAIQVMNEIELELSQTGVSAYPDNVQGMLFDSTPKNEIFASLCLLKGKVLECMDNRGLASECYKQALQYDVSCYEAFNALVKHQMLTALEEEELLASLPIEQQIADPLQAQLLFELYEAKLKKYHKPKRDLGQGSAPSTELCKIRNCLDMKVAEAERLYYNCEYRKADRIAEGVLKEDPYHSDCLLVYISCQVELRTSTKLFTLAHKLVDLYPGLPISWYSIGCYYHIIGNTDNARKYLSKATSVDRLFGPAWLALGHSFALEQEHDQAMAAYFKAAQIMRGCHLPHLYIGVECGLTNNIRLAEKYFKQALDIAPEDPFVLHEMGMVAFQSENYGDAEKHFKEALRRIKAANYVTIPYEWTALLNNLGHTCRKLKRYEAALEYHHEALLLSPLTHSIFSAIAFTHSLMGNARDAAEWFHKALGLKSDDSFSTTMLNYVLEQLADEEPPFPDNPNYEPCYLENLKISETTTDDVGMSTCDSLINSEMNAGEVDMSISDVSGMIRD